MAKRGLGVRQIQSAAAAAKAFLLWRRLALTSVCPPSYPFFHSVGSSPFEHGERRPIPAFHVPKKAVASLTSVAKGQPRFATSDLRTLAINPEPCCHRVFVDPQGQSAKKGRDM
jgi:hypothetical protein